MAGIKKLKSGRYQARYFAGYDGRGKRICPSKTFSHYGDAAKWRTARIREKDLGQQPELSRMLVSEYLREWLEQRVSKRRTNTIKSYTQSVEVYINPYLGGVILQSLKPLQIEQWQDDLSDQKLKGSTIRLARTHLNVALNRAVKLRHILFNPIAATDPPRYQKPKVKVLDSTQQRRFLVECGNHRWGLSYRFALEVGVRPEELFALKWECLELETHRGACHIREVVVFPKGGGWLFEQPKSESGNRQLVFSGQLAKELKAHRVRQHEQRLAVGSAWHDLDLVFANAIGCPLNRSDHRNEFKNVLKAAGLPQHFRLYDLRHSFATLGLMAGVDTKTISDELGHSNFAFTMNTYAHVLREMKERAVDKRERFLKRKK